MSLEEFVTKTLALLEKEREAEIEETRYLYERLPPKQLQKKGVCLLKLQIGNHASGLYGRMVITFEPFWMKKEFPPHNLTPGDIVQLSLNQSSTCQSEGLATGLVSKVTSSSIAIAFDESQNVDSLATDTQYKLLKVANDVTYKRLKRALTELHKAEHGPAGHLVNTLFGDDLYPPGDSQNLEFFNANLNKCQRQAVEFGMTQRELAIIHGPPGTGKTTTVVEIILQAVKQKHKVLACAPSNIAVDNLVERLVAQKQRVIRIGHPARQLPHLQKYCLDAILTSSSGGKLVQDVRKDLDKACSQMLKSNRSGERHKYREEMKTLRKELRQRMILATKEVLENADVVLSTLTSASEDSPLKELKNNHFNLLVIDECSQAIEAACWIPLPRSPKCILAGDHHQLPPTIISDEAAKEGLKETLMERMLKVHGDKVKWMLTTQYRMHQLIMEWSSVQLYQSQLIADSSVKGHLLNDLEGIEENELTCEPLLLIDTAGCYLYELDVPEEISKGNEGEADIVNHHVRKLISSGLSVEDIAVIAPYNLQVELLRMRLSSDYPKLEIKSVDGFQGREKEAVIISLVRSNKKGDVGFLSENRRINVAITRARRHLTLVCDSETVSHNDFLRSLVDYMSDKGLVHTAHEYIQDGITGGASCGKLELLDDIEKNKKKEKKGKQKADGEKESRKLSKKENDEKRHNTLHKILTDFANSNEETTMTFPSDLNSFERMLVHEIADKLGLVHISEGEGKDRYIVVKKTIADKEETQVSVDDELQDGLEKLEVVDLPQDGAAESEFVDVPTSASNDMTESQELSVDSNNLFTASTTSTVKENKKSKSSKKPNKSPPVSTFDAPLEASEKCPHCSRNILESNLYLHTIHCSKRAKSNTQSPKQDAKPKSKTKKTDKMATALDRVDPDDFDALVSAAMAVNNKCSFPKCREKTHVLSVNCEFCRVHFCLSHSMAEIHGCGAEAKAQARRVIIRDGVIHRGSGVPSKLPNATKKAQLHNKLDKRLTEMLNQRKAKSKKS